MIGGVRSIRRALGRLGRDAGGVAAMEFAFVAPIFIFMTTAAIDLGSIQWGRAQLNGATQIAGRKIIQSKSGTTAVRKQKFEDTVANAMQSFRRPDGKTMSIDIRKYSNFSAISPPEPFEDGSRDLDKDGDKDGDKNGLYDLGEIYTDTNKNAKWDDDSGIANDLGGVGDVIKVEVRYPLKPVFSYSTALFGSNGEITVGATTVFRNEPE